jgi:hypothetical protein
MIDLKDLEERIAENEKHGLYTSPAVKELIAELRMRRAQVDGYRMMIDGLENAAHEERAAVVAFLREGDTVCMQCGDRATLDLAYRIECGEHRKEKA